MKFARDIIKISYVDIKYFLQKLEKEKLLLIALRQILKLIKLEPVLISQYTKLKNQKPPTNKDKVL